MTDPSVQQRREIYFQGRVQGVGFRYTTRQIAASFQVTGYVRNLPDGRVLLVAAGTPSELDRFWEAIETHLGRYIYGRQEAVYPDNGQFQRFEIRY